MHRPPDPLAEFLRTLPPTGNGAPPLVVFDCDGTLVLGDTGESMFFHQVDRFLLRVPPDELWPDHPDRTGLRALFDRLAPLPGDTRRGHPDFLPFAEMLLSWYFDQLAAGRTAKACGDIVRLWTGFSVDEVRTVARAVLADELAAPLERRTIGRFSLARGIRFLTEPVAWLRDLRTRGWSVLIVSGSNRWIVEAVGAHIGVPPADVLGIGLTTARNLLSTEFDGPVTVLEGKIEALRARTTAAPALVVSDSVFDLPLFGYSAGLRILVKPRTGPDLFETGAAVRDHRWMVLERPTLAEAV